MPARIQLRRGSKAFWESENPILHPGEPGVELHPNNPARFKVGDGTTPWLALPYSPDVGGSGGGTGGDPGGGTSDDDIPDLVLFYNNGKV
jgi:hypothetical protein